MTHDLEEIRRLVIDLIRRVTSLETQLSAAQSMRAAATKHLTDQIGGLSEEVDELKVSAEYVKRVRRDIWVIFATCFFIFSVSTEQGAKLWGIIKNFIG